MKSFELSIIVANNDPWVANAYEPFDGCAFVVHRPFESADDWNIAHRGSTFIAGHASTRKLALEIAAGLHEACPHAGKVRAATKKDGSFAKLVGPHRILRHEIKVFHERAAA